MVTFINTALILPAIQADLTYYGLGEFFNVFFSDFSVKWYASVGTLIVDALKFAIYWPIIEFCGFFSLRLLWRVLDKGFCCCKKSTRKKTIQAYVQTHSGPQFLIHYKYAACEKFVYISFMYGIGMPILFPISLAALIVLYIVERLLVAYSYKEPPSYDEQVTKSSIKSLKWAVLIYLGVGYWMLSNQQIFGNKVFPIEFLNSPRRTGHDIFALPNIVPSVPFFFMFFAMLFLIISDRINKKVIKKIYKAGADNIGEIDEKLENYFIALNYDAKEWIVAEEKLNRSKLNIKTLSNRAYEKLQEAYETPIFLEKME